jgi:hypothetical protein
MMNPNRLNDDDIVPGLKVDKGVTTYTVKSHPRNGIFTAIGPDGMETRLAVEEVIQHIPGDD